MAGEGRNVEAALFLALVVGCGGNASSDTEGRGSGSSGTDGGPVQSGGTSAGGDATGGAAGSSGGATGAVAPTGGGPTSAGGTTGGSGIDDTQACLDAGGTVETISCCHTLGDFPNLCNGAACTCDRGLHDVLSCRCPEGTCFVHGACAFDCGLPPDCNWCGGTRILDEDGCPVGYTCANGRDACSATPCDDATDCSDQTEECTDWGVCWHPATSVTGEFRSIANPCTTQPCTPGMVSGIVATDQTYVLVLGGRWIWYSSDWESWPGAVPESGQQVVARGDLDYGTEYDGDTFVELVLTSLEIVQ